MRNGDGEDRKRQETQQAAENPPTGDETWWAGLGWPGGVLLLTAGVGLLLWLLITGKTADDNWSAYYGVGKVLAVGCVVTGTALLAHRRKRNG